MRSPLARGLRAFALAASLAFLASPHEAHAQAPAPDPAKIEEAKKHMQAGASFYNDPSGHKCEEAYREFRKAFDLSGSLNALKGMGVCSLELERDGEAIEELSKYVDAKGEQLDPTEKTQVEGDVAALKAVVAWVKLDTDHPGVRISDTRTPARGYPITNKYNLPVAGKKLGLHPGSHVLTASAEGVPDQVWKVEISNGGTYSRRFEYDAGKPVTAEGFGVKDLAAEPPKPPQPTTRPVPKAAYVFAVTTVAAAVPWAIFGVTALGKESDYKKLNGTESASQLQPLHDQVKSNDLLADVFMGVTAASLVTTAVIYLARPAKAAASTGLETVRVAPAIGRGSGGVGLSATF